MTEDLPLAYQKLRDDFNSAASQPEQAMLPVRMPSTRGPARSPLRPMIYRAAPSNRRQASKKQPAALEQTTATVNKTAQGATHAREVLAKSKTDAEKGGEIVRQAVEAVAMIVETDFADHRGDR